MDFAELSDADRADLDDYVGARFNLQEAWKQAALRRERPEARSCYKRRINRLAKNLGFNSLHDLLVQYELTCKNARTLERWRRLLAATFSGERQKEHPEAFGHLEMLWQMHQTTGRFNINALADQLGCAPRTITGRIRQLAYGAGFDYSVPWLVFLRSLRQELLPQPSPSAEYPPLF